MLDTCFYSSNIYYAKARERKLFDQSRKEEKDMIIKIARTNEKGQEKETLLNTDYIISVCEKTYEPTRLYDEEGNVVEERESDKKGYVVIAKGGNRYNLNETQYNDLVTKLGL